MQRGTKTSVRGITRLSKTEMVVRVLVEDPSTNKRREVERRVTTSSLAEAVKARDDLRLQVLAEFRSASAALAARMTARSTEAVTLTLTDYAKRWVTHLKNTGRNRPHVLSQRVDTLNRFILPAMGDARLVDIGPQQLAAWMEHLGTLRQENGAPYRLPTLRSIWAVFRNMLRDAVVLAGLPHDPTAGVRFHAVGEPAKPKDTLTREEVHRLLACTTAESPDVRAMIWLGFTTGTRFGELSALVWDDVDFERGLIRVARSQVRGHVGTTKTGTVRTVPLNAALAGILKAHQQWQQKEGVRGLLTGLIFPARSGKHRHASVLVRPLQRCAERAGIKKHVSAHTMRRTMNNLLRMASGDIVARSVTGHATAEMTEHYSHVSAVEKQEAQKLALGDLSAMVSPKSGEESGEGPEKVGKLVGTSTMVH